MSSITSKSRVNISSFDFIKGIVILLVIIIHTFAHVNYKQSFILRLLGYFLRAIRPGAMPVLLMITGFCFKSRPMKRMLKETFSRLIIPYFWVMLAYATICPVLYWPVYRSWDAAFMHSMKYVVAFLLGLGSYGKIILGLETAWNTAAWYLLAIFTAQNALNLIAKIKKPANQVSVVICCILTGYVLLQFDLGFFCIAQGLLSIGFCYLGYILKKNNFLERLRSSMLACCVVTLIYILELKFGFFDIFTGQCSNLLLDYIGSACSGLLLMFVGLHFGKYEWRGLDWIKQIGLYSYWILAIHAAEMEVVPWWHFLAAPLSENQFLAFVLEIIIKGILFTTICMVLKKLTKYKYQKRVMLRER